MAQPREEGERRFPTVYIHRGLCGIALKVQCMYIGITYIMVNMIGVLIASMMIGNPQRYLDYDKLRRQLSAHQNSISNETEVAIEDDLPSNSIESKMDRITEQALIDIGSNGIEIMVEALFMLIVSTLLVHGLRKDKCTFIFPWVIVNILCTLANFVTMMVKFAVITYIGVLEMIISVMFLFVTSYFILSVYSYYQLLKIRKAKVISFLSNEFQADPGSLPGTGYRVLVEDESGSASYDNPPAYSDLPLTSTAIPFTEKNVPMTEEEDVNKENVLYVQQ